MLLRSSILMKHKTVCTSFTNYSCALRPVFVKIATYYKENCLFSYKNLRIVGMFRRIWGCESSWRKIFINFIAYNQLHNI